MSAPSPADVAAHLGVPYDATDVRLVSATAAANAWVEDRRSLTDPLHLWESARVIQGAILYAGLIYQSRSQPEGFPGFSDLGTYSEDYGQSMVQVHRLVGVDVVVG